MEEASAVESDRPKADIERWRTPAEEPERWENTEKVTPLHRQGLESLVFQLVHGAILETMLESFLMVLS
jgi:hypothetical protein